MLGLIAAFAAGFLCGTFVMAYRTVRAMRRLEGGQSC